MKHHCCQQCGKKLNSAAKLCMGCYYRRRSGQGVVIEPTDRQSEKRMKDLIDARKRELLPANVCVGDDPAEELAIRKRMGLK